MDRKADVLCLEETARDRGRGGVGISPLEYKIRKRKKVWIATQMVSGLVVDKRPD